MLHYKQSDGYAGGLNLSLNMVIFVICEVKGKLQPNIFHYVDRDFYNLFKFFNILNEGTEAQIIYHNNPIIPDKEKAKNCHLK